MTPALPRFPIRRWILAIAPLLVFGAAVATRLGDPDATYHMEVLALTSSQETWIRQLEGDGRAWRTPSLGGLPRVRKPPGIVWTNLAAWRGLEPGPDGVDQRVARARIVAAALYGGLAVGGVAVMGWTLGGRALAWRSSLALAAMLGVARQARLASYDTHLAAWAAAAVALGWLAIGQWDRGRRIGLPTAAAAAACAGWAAWVKGPIALLMVGLPWALGAGLLTRRGTRGVALAAAMALAAGAAVLPWYLHVVPQFAEVLADEYRAGRAGQPPYYYVGALGLLLPWTVAWLGQAWTTAGGWRAASSAERIACAWFVGGIAILSLAEAKQQRYIFPLMPAGALMVGQWWQRLGDPGSERPIAARGYRRFTRAHGGLLILTTAGAGLFVLLQPALVEWGVLDEPELPGVRAVDAILSLGASAALAVYAWRALARQRSAAAMAATGLWFAALFSFGMRYYVDSSHGVYRERETALAFARRVPDREVAYLKLDDDWRIRPDHKFALYAEKRMPPVTDPAALFLGRTNAPAWIVARDVPTETDLLLRCGYRPEMTFREGAYVRVAWKRER